MCLDDFSLAGDGEVASFILAFVQLGQVRDNVSGSETHPNTKYYQYIITLICMMKDKIETDGLKIYPYCLVVYRFAF